MLPPSCRELREDFVESARNLENSVTNIRFALDFGSTASIIQNLLVRSGVEESNQYSQAAATAAEARDLTKRIRQLERGRLGAQEGWGVSATRAIASLWLFQEMRPLVTKCSAVRLQNDGSLGALARVSAPCRVP